MATKKLLIVHVTDRAFRKKEWLLTAPLYRIYKGLKYPEGYRIPLSCNLTMRGGSAPYQPSPAHIGNSEQLFGHLINILPVAVYTCDNSGFITYYNEHAAKLWGRRPELGRDLWCGSWKIYSSDGTPLPLDS